MSLEANSYTSLNNYNMALNKEDSRAGFAAKNFRTQLRARRFNNRESLSGLSEATWQQKVWANGANCAMEMWPWNKLARQYFILHLAKRKAQKSKQEAAAQVKATLKRHINSAYAKRVTSRLYTLAFRVLMCLVLSKATEWSINCISLVTQNFPRNKQMNKDARDKWTMWIMMKLTRAEVSDSYCVRCYLWSIISFSAIGATISALEITRTRSP